MNDQLNAVIGANRFGLGARPGEIAWIKHDPREWLKAQVKGVREVPPLIAELTPADQIHQSQVATLRARIEAQRAASANNSSQSTLAVAEVSNTVRENFLAQVNARYQVAIRSEEPFRERLVHFWSNHFAVSMDKNIVSAMAGAMENEAIRPNLSGSFYQLLLAAESHPAMITYLDNQLSIGPNSTVAQMIARRGSTQRNLNINENLGREILELHTLGVSGGYTQSDVTSFAKVLTGWSISETQGPLALTNRVSIQNEQIAAGQFIYRDGLHEPEAQTILGKRYAQQGLDQAKAVLKDLSNHPSTARFIATKLARHFIADEPPAAAVDRIAKVFLDTEGDLPSVHSAVVDSAEAWAYVATKFKTPHEFVISTFRAVDYVPERPLLITQPLQSLGQVPFTPGSPAGWDDVAGRWDGSDALMKRIEWATQFSQRANIRQSPVQIAEQSLGDALGEHSRMALTGAADRVQGMVLWLVSPEFQRR